MADNELANSKCGINVTWGTGDGSDKGTAYQEEYLYHNKHIYCDKVVYLKSGTAISMSHNERNIAHVNGRDISFVGTGGLGVIRYQVDKFWSRTSWAPPGATYTGYSGTFSLNQLTYTSGQPIVGGTGTSNTSTGTLSTFYFKGIVDSVGDEWHILRYADDEQAYTGASNDSYATDGNHIALVVNPKTPCITIRTGVSGSTSGQFYTTPAWTYLIPKIHDQTTYFHGPITIELRDIFNNNIFYRTGTGGSFINAGANNVTLSGHTFNTGLNYLQYFYSGNSGFVKTRRLVKIPDGYNSGHYPSFGETHGDFMWGTGNWPTVLSRITREPYTSTFSTYNGDSYVGHADWETTRNSGWRRGGTVTPYRVGPASTNAFLAKYHNWTGVRAGSIRTYADYAKEMMLDNTWTLSPLGYEIYPMASMSMPTAENNYRGYWDVSMAYNPILAYDVLIANYRKDQNYVNGITPVEDYFFRDTMAKYVHLQSLPIGGHLGPDPGMWTTCRNVGALMIALIMSKYSTSYYGTCGMDGNTTTYSWTPFPGTNYTWKRLFLNSDYTIGSYPNASIPFGMHDGQTGAGGLGLIKTTGAWVDRAPYTSLTQCGYSMMLYRIFQNDYNPSGLILPMDKYFLQSASGIAWPLKSEPNGGGQTAFHRTNILLYNARFPEITYSGKSKSASLPDSSGQSIKTCVNALGWYAISYYDDEYEGSSGLDSDNPNFNIISGYYEDPQLVTLTTPRAATIYYTTGGSDPLDGSNNPISGAIIYSGAFLIGITGQSTTTVVKSVAVEPAKEPSDVVRCDVAVDDSGRPSPPQNLNITF